MQEVNEADVTRNLLLSCAASADTAGLQKHQVVHFLCVHAVETRWPQQYD